MTKKWGKLQFSDPLTFNDPISLKILDRNENILFQKSIQNERNAYLIFLATGRLKEENY